MLDRRHPHRLTNDAYLEPNRVVFVTVCTKRRQPILAPDERAVIVIDCLRNTFAADLVAYCVMPDHVHAVVVTDGQTALPKLVGLFKGRAALALGRVGAEKPIWGKSLWDRHARGEDDVPKMIDYVLNNPVRKELCGSRDEWPYGQFGGFPW